MSDLFFKIQQYFEGKKNTYWYHVELIDYGGKL